MRISDWSSDVCSSDLSAAALRRSLCLQSRPWHLPGYAAGARGPDDGADPRLARNRGPRAMSRTAVVLFNLGGPDRPEAVEPFLFNLFFDPAIIRLPAPLRWLVAKLISRRRAPVAQAIYHEMGGGSPWLPTTQEPAGALTPALETARICEDEAFIARRSCYHRARAPARRRPPHR